MEKEHNCTLPIIGEITYYATGETVQYTDPEQYLADIKKNLDELGINGWKYDTAGGDLASSSSQDAEQRRIASNKAHSSIDMPECIRLLTGLEEELQGQKGQFGEWMRISYELNEDYEFAPAEMAQEICNAFRQVNHQYGNRIACNLYASCSVVLPYEIVHAADYLSMGGKLQDINDLAKVGVFMGNYDLLGYDVKTEMVAFINNGGSPDDVYDIINQKERHKASDQAEDGSPALCQ